MVGAVIDHRTAEGKGHRGSRGKEEPVAEGNVGAHRTAVASGLLLGVAGLGNRRIGMIQKRAVAVGEDGAQIEEALLHAVIGRHGAGRLNFANMLLPVADGKRIHVFRSVLAHSPGQKRRGIDAAGAQHQSFGFGHGSFLPDP